MPLNIKNSEVERLAAEVAALAHETKTEAIRRALLDRKQRLIVRRGGASKLQRLQDILRNQIWPEIPVDVRGRGIAKAEREKILGYGRDGV
jgi:antitoxin VapB